MITMLCKCKQASPCVETGKPYNTENTDMKKAENAVGMHKEHAARQLRPARSSSGEKIIIPYGKIYE